MRRLFRARGASGSGRDSAERFGDLRVAITRRVLVAHGSPGRGVAEPLHQLRKRGPRRGGENRPRMPEVVEAQVGSTRRVSGLAVRLSWSRRSASGVTPSAAGVTLYGDRQD